MPQAQTLFRLKHQILLGKCGIHSAAAQTLWICLSAQHKDAFHFIRSTFYVVTMQAKKPKRITVMKA